MICKQKEKIMNCSYYRIRNTSRKTLFGMEIIRKTTEAEQLKVTLCNNHFFPNNFCEYHREFTRNRYWNLETASKNRKNTEVQHISKFRY